MSIMTTIQCDGDGCGRQEQARYYTKINEFEGVRTPPHSVRRLLRDFHGWVQVNNLDYCKACWEKLGMLADSGIRGALAGTALKNVYLKAKGPDPKDQNVHRQSKPRANKGPEGGATPDDDSSQCYKCGQNLFDDQPEDQGDLCARCYMGMT